MQQALGRITVPTTGTGLFDITRAVGRWVAAQGILDGLLTVFLRHTSASLVIQENADPTVRADLEAFFRRIVPEQAGLYRHDAEGPDDMPAHIRAALTATTLGIPLEGGRLALGTWQAIYVWEHRAAPHRRDIALHLIGTP
jgi:secondary thiamine-phosphate synthase enzyme